MFFLIVFGLGVLVLILHYLSICVQAICVQAIGVQAIGVQAHIHGCIRVGAHVYVCVRTRSYVCASACVATCACVSACIGDFVCQRSLICRQSVYVTNIGASNAPLHPQSRRQVVDVILRDHERLKLLYHAQIYVRCT